MEPCQHCYPPPQTLCLLSPCVPPSAVLLGTGLCHTDAVTTSFGQDAGTSPPTAMSNGTAQPMGECWGSARARQHCRENGEQASAGPVPQNDPSFPVVIPKIAGQCHEALPATAHSGGSQQQLALPLCPWHCPVLLQAPGSTAGLLQASFLTVLMSLPLAWAGLQISGVTWQQGQAGMHCGQRHAAPAQHLSSQSGITPTSHGSAGITLST